MPPKTIASPQQVEKEFIRRCEKQGMLYTPYEKSYLAKKKSNGNNRDLTRGTNE